jgi:putative pyruvate formate lyase activating enzyme
MSLSPPINPTPETKLTNQIHDSTMWRLQRPDAARVFDDPLVQRSLSRYIEVVKNRKQAKFLLNKAMHVEFSENNTMDELWHLHNDALEHFPNFLTRKATFAPVKNSFLDLKDEIARRVMKDCHFCERRCGVDRFKGQKSYCSCDDKFHVYSAFPHLGEEPELVPSGTVFTGGCTIRCIHCQNYDISQWKSSGTPVVPEQMVRIVDRLASEGCRNLNMVGGDPTPNTWLWIETMKHVERNIATVWNSNSYYSEETAKLLAEFIDVYLLDFKYGNNKCASEISDAPGYWETATRSHLYAKKHGELIIRVLVLPGHNDCCTRPILQWVQDNLGPYTRVNLMFQYRPEWKAHTRKELRKRLNSNEIDEAKHIAEEVGLKNLVH